MQEYNIKSIRQEFKEKGVFYTQKELALYLKSLLPDDVTEIYDPTCGNGGLLSVFDDDVQKYGQDINAEQVQVATEYLKNFHGAVGDTLMNPSFNDKQFKYIIANPPFSIKWEPDLLKSDKRFSILPCMPPKSKADYAFIAHILYELTDDGMAVILNFPGILYRGNSEGKIRKWLVEQNYIDTVISIDGGHFVDTKIATAVLIIRKNKKDKNIKFVHNDREIVVPFEKVEENDFNLSVSSYLIEEVKKEIVDPIALEKQARRTFLRKLKKELDFEKMVCEMENISMKPFISAIKRIVKWYE